MSDDSQVTIDRVDLGTGWVVFQAGKQPPEPRVLPELLNHAMTTWLQRHAEFRVRAALPIVVDGNTMAIHVWFE